MFYPESISACAPFGDAADGRFNKQTCQHEDFSAQGIFSMRNLWHHGHFGKGYLGTRTFRHMDILAPCEAIWMFWLGHFGTCAIVPKCPCAKMSPCWNVPVPKIPHAENSSCRKVPMSKCSHDETSVPKWLLPKCSVPKWWIGILPIRLKVVYHFDKKPCNQAYC